MGRVPRAVGTGVFLALMAIAALTGGDVGTFFNGPGLVVVVGGTASLLLASFGVRGWRDRPGRFFRMAAVYALATGFLGMLIGLIQMLTNLDDPSRLGPGAALCLLTQLYGVGLALPCVAAALMTPDDDRAPARDVTRLAVPFAAVVASVGTVVTLATILTIMFVIDGRLN